MIKPFPADPKADKDKCKDTCDNCWCWVCDEKVKDCTDWESHCLCDGSPEWAVERSKLKRRKEKQTTGQVPRATDSDDAVNARYAAAQQVAHGGGPASADDAARQEERENNKEDEENEELFAEYAPLHLDYGQPHPDAVVETTSLSFAELPPITYQIKLPAGLYRPRSDANPYGGGLSRAQLETVAYACQRFEQKLPTGARAGFFLGDGVGLGKGRQLAGIILDGWQRDRKRHLWVSVSADLCVDAQRDLSDIGAGHIDVVNITKVGYEKNALEKALKTGVLFSTYSALTNSGKGGSRLDQIARWLGEDKAEGCILFDESHKAKHLFPTTSDDDGGGRGKKAPAKKKSTKMAQACQGIQQRCPNGRVVYCSATGASSLDNMAYMERLGLWGPGTPFADGFGSFSSQIGNGGVGAMELVALDMKRRGMYISRQLSFKSATYDTMVIDLTPSQEAMYAQPPPHLTSLGPTWPPHLISLGPTWPPHLTSLGPTCHHALFTLPPIGATWQVRCRHPLLDGDARLLPDRHAHARGQRHQGPPERPRDDPLLGLPPALLPPDVHGRQGTRGRPGRSGGPRRQQVRRHRAADDGRVAPERCGQAGRRYASWSRSFDLARRTPAALRLSVVLTQRSVDRECAPQTSMSMRA